MSDSVRVGSEKSGSGLLDESFWESDGGAVQLKRGVVGGLRDGMFCNRRVARVTMV